MPANLLTELKVKNAKTKSGETLLADGEGLYLRLRPTGKDWLFIFSLDGRRRKQGLGAYPDVTLGRAREKAEVSRALVADGFDPVQHRDAEEAKRRAEDAAQAARHTVRTLFEEWHRKEASHRKDSGAEIRRAFEKDILPAIGEMFADDVKRRDVMRVLDDVKERGVGRYANVLLQYLRQMFRFAALREIVPGDPTFGLTKKGVGGAEEKRTRHLSEDEIAELAEKLPAAKLTPMATAALWIMLSTCCRVGEISRARWADIDLEAGTWIIPKEHAKNGLQHLIHLSDFAVRQFEALRSVAVNDTWIFPNRTGKSHVSTKSLQKQFRDRQRTKRLRGRSKAAGVLSLSGGEWCAHDLRRTGSTLMGELRVSKDVIERCLNHVGASKLENTYQRQQLIADRMEAFKRLGERLELLANGKRQKVTPIRRAG
jgi:integrase